MDWYCKSNSLVHVPRLFDKTPHPNIIPWDIAISGFDLNQFTYESVLSACTALKSPLYDELVYSLALKNGFFSNGYVQVGMINLFTRPCSFEGVSRRFM